MTKVAEAPRAGAGSAPGPRRQPPFVVQFWRSAVAKKWLMAITGLLLMGFVLAHMIGNLKMYTGAEKIDHYAEWLRTIGEPILPETGMLWILRVGLLGAAVIHVVAAAQLTAMNRRARDTRYQSPRDYAAANFASRTMRWTGVIVLLFVIFHLLDLTWGVTDPDFVKGAVYDNIINSFQRVPVAVFYIVANLALAFHLGHGAWSMFQSLGWNSPRYNQARRAFAIGFAVVIAVGNISMPLLVVTKVVQ